MLNIPYLRELCENAPPFVISAVAREALPELLDRVEALDKVAEAAILECKDHGDPYQSGHCDCDLCTALRAAGYGG